MCEPSRQSKRRWTRAGVSLGLLCGACCFPPAAQSGPSTVPSNFVDELRVGGLDEPVGFAPVPDPPSVPSRRVLVVEQRTARVRLLIGAATTIVGTVPGVESADTERGLLGITVDPGWPARPYIYIHATDNRFGNHVVVSRFTLTGDLGYTSDGHLLFDATSRYDLVFTPDNAINHNGGTVRFGPDGYLYVSLGDDATGCPAQDSTELVGKILRLDVNRLPAGPGGPAPIAILAPPSNPFANSPDSSARLVWALGLRNPFRFQIDPFDGALFIGDVGESSWEEVDRVATGGKNMGWPLKEGPADFITCAGFDPPSLVAPIYYYDHSTGVVVIAAALYRGPGGGGGFPAAYDGNFFLLDYYTGIMRRLTGSGSSWIVAPPVTGQPSALDWGEGLDAVSDAMTMADGTIWYCRQSVSGAPSSGEIRRIRYASSTSVRPGDGTTLRLAAPVPTPSRDHVTLSWSQPEADVVRLVVYDAGGRAVRVLVDGGRLEAGAHERTWDGRGASGDAAPAGLYFARLTVGDVTRAARIVRLR